MIEKDGRDLLLDDVFQDEKLEALRQSIQEGCRKELARKRRTPFQWWYVPAAAVLLFVLVRLLVSTEDRISPYSPGPSTGGEDKPYYVKTVPLSKDVIVRSRSAEYLAVSTTDFQPVNSITDEEMLAFFAGTPCGLIPTGDHRKKLVFIHPEDEERFLGKIGG